MAVRDQWGCAGKLWNLEMLRPSKQKDITGEAFVSHASPCFLLPIPLPNPAPRLLLPALKIFLVFVPRVK